MCGFSTRFVRKSGKKGLGGSHSPEGEGESATNPEERPPRRRKTGARNKKGKNTSHETQRPQERHSEFRNSRSKNRTPSMKTQPRLTSESPSRGAAAPANGHKSKHIRLRHPGVCDKQRRRDKKGVSKSVGLFGGDGGSLLPARAGKKGGETSAHSEPPKKKRKNSTFVSNNHVKRGETVFKWGPNSPKNVQTTARGDLHGGTRTPST